MNADGTVTMKLVDYYDFSKLDDGGFFNYLNNNAHHQQELGKLKPYVMYFEFTYHL